MKEVVKILPERKEYCLLIKSAFSEGFCDRIIQDKKKTFKEAITHYPTSYRNNERQIVDNDTLSNELFEEIKKYIPKVISIEGISKEEQGEWELMSLNSRIRLCRYLPNQYFNKHLDGIHFESDVKQSKLTFMIYLNGTEDFEGGRTLFFNSKEDDRIIGEYQPQKGDLIIFDHNLWHSGEKVIKGEKYILRSDIMYGKIGKTNLQKNEFCGEGHLGYIWTIILFNDFLITSGRDKKIKVWSKDGKKLSELIGHKNSIISLIGINEKKIVSASRDMSIKIWEQQTNKAFTLVKNIELHKGAVLSLCKVNDNEFLSGDAKGIVNYIDINGDLLDSHQAHNEWIWGIAKVNEKFYATISEDGSIVIWSLDNHKEILRWKGEVPINSLVVENEQTIFIGRLDGTIIKLGLDIANKKIEVLNEKKCHEGIIRSLKVDEERLYSASEDNTLKIWDKENIEFITLHKHNNFVQDIALCEDCVISVSYDGEIKKNKK